MNEQNLADQTYWDSSYKDLKFFKADKNDPLIQFFEKTIDKKHISGKSIFEIGCFPGRYLVWFGDHGCRLNGLDLTPRTSTEMASWLKAEGYNTGEFYQESIEEFNHTTKYDIVCSFGFIEHFTNWFEIIANHDKLLARDGVLIITTPNFKGLFQYIGHRYLDNENLKRHNLKSMSPVKWRKQLERLGYEIIFSGSFGGFDFWVDNEKRSPNKVKLLKWITQKLTPALKKKISYNHFSYSPYLGIVAIKK